MPKVIKLPVAGELVRKNSSVLNTAQTLFIQHLKMDTASLLQCWKNSGSAVASCIAIPYSLDLDAKSKALGLGIDVKTPSLDSLFATLKETMLELEDSSLPVLVQDVGGHFADFITKEKKYPSNVIGVVEETRQGLWRYEALNHPTLPVVQIADSPLKKIEARYVGRSVVNTTAEMLRNLGVSVFGLDVLVLGYGDIGDAAADALRSMGAHVSVFDVAGEKRLKALGDGFKVSSVKEALKTARVVVGCAGKPSINAADFPENSSGEFLLFSGSSRRVEFANLTGDLTASCLFDGLYSHVATNSYVVSGSKVHVVNNGEPVNFLHESLPTSIIDLVFAQIAVGAVDIISKKAKPGVHGLGESSLEDIASSWLKVYNSE